MGGTIKQFGTGMTALKAERRDSAAAGDLIVKWGKSKAPRTWP
jgi:hypothetical protein